MKATWYDAAHPGTLPLLNRGCIDALVRTGFALNAKLRQVRTLGVAFLLVLPWVAKWGLFHIQLCEAFLTLFPPRADLSFSAKALFLLGSPIGLSDNAAL